MLRSILIHKKETLDGTIQNIPASKSISNRVLIMDALGGKRSTLHNLSDANDTQLMKKLLDHKESLIDVEDAGTTMRFLTAYFSLQGERKTIAGSERMKQRPIGILVEALRLLGVSIRYVEKEGYPPIEILGFNSQQTSSISIRGDVSSQYISALMMIAPVLPQGLTLQLEGEVGSWPYIEMTASLMKRFGVECSVTGNTIEIPHQTYQQTDYAVESDWSAASYWYSFVALAKDGGLILPHVTLRSLQGDQIIVDMMESLGVKSEPRGDKLLLAKVGHHDEFNWDFTHCPDLAQTIAVVCAVKGIRGKFTGLKSLRIKETDRIKALQNELRKLNADFIEESETSCRLVPTSSLPDRIPLINTYLDHRMAMAFAPLATQADIEIENPDVVKKSYPKFWEDIKRLGFNVSGDSTNFE